MTRSAKLFYLTHQDNITLKEAVLRNTDYTLKDQIAIFKLNVDYHRYLILSISEKVDNIPITHGCDEADKRDLWNRDFKETDCKLIFGNEFLSNFLEYS